MGDTTKVELGVCSVSFGGTDLGYTAGGVKCKYSAETKEIIVDQEDAPIGERVTKQNFEVTVPLAEYDLSRFADLLPGATYTGSAATKEKLALSGAAGVDLLDLAQELIITPSDSTSSNDIITIYYAVPDPNFEFAYEKDNTRVYEVTFKALKGTNGFVLFGDTTAV